MKHVVRNACKNELPKNQSAEGTTEKTLLSCLQHFLYHYIHEYRGSVLRTPPPAWKLSSLTALFKLKIEKFVETRQCDHKNKHTLTRLIFFCCVVGFMYVNYIVFFWDVLEYGLKNVTLFFNKIIQTIFVIPLYIEGL